MIDSCNRLNGSGVVRTECDEQSVPEGSANGRKVSGTRETVKTSFPAKVAGYFKSLFKYSVETLPSLTSKLVAGFVANQSLPMVGAAPTNASYLNTTIAANTTTSNPVDNGDSGFIPAMAFLGGVSVFAAAVIIGSNMPKKGERSTCCDFNEAPEHLPLAKYEKIGNEKNYGAIES